MKTPKATKAHQWPRDRNDWYVEPHWCSRRLFEVETFSGWIEDSSAGLGRIVIQARRAGYHAEGFDLIHRKPGRHGMTIEGGRDFLKDGVPVDNIVSNPPFKHIEEYTRLAVDLARAKVALMFPIRRIAHALWLRDLPLSKVYWLTPRPSMPPGKIIMEGRSPGSGQQDFAWLVFDKTRANAIDAQHLWLHRDE